MSDDRCVIEWGVATQALAGHGVSGDAYVVEPFASGVLVGVIDGLGHGDRAAAVAKKAVATLKAHPHEPVGSLMERCHEKLRGSRGAVISLASFNPRKETMTWLGVGNVDGILLKADKRSNPGHRSLLLRGGVVGYRLPSLHDAVLAVSPGDLLFFVTDGIRSGFIKEQFQNPYAQTLDNNQSAQQIADTILAQYGRGTDDALVLVARYHGRKPASSGVS